MRQISALLLFVVAAGVLGCDDGKQTCVYTAQRFDAARRCLEAPAALGLVEAEALPANCAPACLEFEGELYVSSVGTPYPVSVNPVTLEAPGCAEAINTFFAGTACSPAQ